MLKGQTSRLIFLVSHGADGRQIALLVHLYLRLAVLVEVIGGAGQHVHVGVVILHSLLGGWLWRRLLGLH